MIKTLPQSLVQSASHVIETHDVLESCKTCGAVVGTCIHEDEIQEDALSAEGTPSKDDPETQLSGDKEDVLINPEYKTSALGRHLA